MSIHFLYCLSLQGAYLRWHREQGRGYPGLKWHSHTQHTTDNLVRSLDYWIGGRNMSNWRNMQTPHTHLGWSQELKPQGKCASQSTTKPQYVINIIYVIYKCTYYRLIFCSSIKSMCYLNMIDTNLIYHLHYNPYKIKSPFKMYWDMTFNAVDSYLKISHSCCLI